MLNLREILPIFVFLIFSTVPAQAGEECYMDTPSGYRGMGGGSRLGPYSSINACRQVNASYFNNQGSCICSDSDASGSSGDYDHAAAARRQAWHQDQIRTQQLQQQEEQKRRAAIEIKRQKEAEENAQKTAQAEADRLEWENKKDELMAALKGSGASGLSLKSSSSTETIRLKPQGTDFFNASLKKHENDATVLAHSVGLEQEASSSSLENIRRSLWLYKKAAQTQDQDEARFLMEQADEAAQGHALKVEVPAADRKTGITPEQLKSFKELVAHVEQNKIQLRLLAEDRQRLEDSKKTLLQHTEDLKRQIDALGKEAQGKETQPATVQPVDQPEPSKSAREEPKLEKKTKGDDLMAEYLAVQKEIQDTNQEADKFLQKETKLRQEYEQSQKQLGQFLEKN